MHAAQIKLNAASRLWTVNVPFFSALYRNAIIFLGMFGLCAMYLMPAKFQYGPIPINVFIPSILVVLGCMTILGKRALTITPFDYLFVAWVSLGYLSHIYANEFLFRTISQEDLQTNIEFIVSLALTYRAFFCLTCLAPELSSKMFIGCSLVTSGGIVLLGIMQRFGPAKSTAIHVGMALSKVPTRMMEAVAVDRPTAIYDNPNMLGYVACIFAVFILGWGLCDLKNLKPWKTISFACLLGLALFGTLACQSRQNAALLAFMFVVCGVLIRRFSKDLRNSLILAFMIGIAVFGAALFLSQSKSSYLLSLTHSSIESDLSYQARAHELKKVQNIAEDIAPLGSGQSAANLTRGGMVAGYSYYRLPNVDSEWGNIYAAFGVWGPLLLVCFYLLNAKITRDVWRIQSPEARMLAVAGLLLLLFNLALTTAAVRVAKYDTGLFSFQILGVIAAWRLYGIERGIIPPTVPIRRVWKKFSAMQG